MVRSCLKPKGLDNWSGGEALGIEFKNEGPGASCSELGVPV